MQVDKCTLAIELLLDCRSHSPGILMNLLTFLCVFLVYYNACIFYLEEIQSMLFYFCMGLGFVLAIRNCIIFLVYRPLCKKLMLVYIYSIFYIFI